MLEPEVTFLPCKGCPKSCFQAKNNKNWMGKLAVRGLGGARWSPGRFTGRAQAAQSCPAAGTGAAASRRRLRGGRTAHQREGVTSTDPSTLPPAAAVPVPSVSSTYGEASLQLPYKSGAAPRSR